MKILFTGGGTGGHFYPIIAIAEALRKISDTEHLIPPHLFYVATDPYDRDALREFDIEFKGLTAGKIRRYHSIWNVIDLFKTALGVIRSIFLLYSIFPDVVFSRGGYVSFPVVAAARFLGIPVVVHESDSKPGRANAWAGKFAVRVAVSFPDAAQYFPKEKVALTGNPMRRDVIQLQRAGAHEFLHLEAGTPTILILGGSMGAQRINSVIIESLSDLVTDFQIIHQTGKNNFDETQKVANVVLDGNKNAARYHPFPYLNSLAMKMAAGAADLVISRAGSTIFEIAAWGVPSIIIPIPEEIAHDQRGNAYSYARSGAAVVMEEKNIAPHLLIAEVGRIMESKEEREKMKKAAQSFARPDAAEKIARELVRIALAHEG